MLFCCCWGFVHYIGRLTKKKLKVLSSICPCGVIDNGRFRKWATSWSRNHVMKYLCCRYSEFSIYSPSLRRRPIRASVIHLLFFRVLIRIIVIAASWEEPRPSSPQSPSPAPPGYHWSNPWIDRKWNHSSMSWLWLGVPTQLDMPKTSPQGEGQTLVLYHTGPVDQFSLTLRAEGFSSAPRAPPSESLSSPAWIMEALKCDWTWNNLNYGSCLSIYRSH